MNKIDFEKLVQKASHKKNSLVSTVKKVNKSLNGHKINKSEIIHNYGEKN